jgi:dTDP-4-dehydrorhamnose reductase
VNILVTGSGGLVGSALMRTGSVMGFERAALDITDSRAVAGVIDELQPDAIINAAAQAGVDRADTEPEWTRAVNGTAVGTLAAMCAERGVRLVHLSTDYVLDYPQCERLEEDLEPNPQSTYARTKHEGELMALEHSAVVVRLQWVYHPGSGGFFNYALKQMAAGKVVRLVTDQVGCPTPASLLAPALIQMATDGPTGIFHLATQGEATAWEWIEAGARAFGVDFVAEPALRADFDGAHRPARSCLDSAKVEAAWGIRLPDWRSALQTAVHSGDRLGIGVAP